MSPLSIQWFLFLFLSIIDLSTQRCDYVNQAKHRPSHWPCQMYLSLGSHFKHRCSEWVGLYGESFTNVALNVHRGSNSSLVHANCDALYIMQTFHAEGLGSTLSTKIHLYEEAMHLGIDRIIHTPLTLSGHDPGKKMSIEKLFMFTHSEFCIEELQKKCNHKLKVLDYDEYRKTSNISRMTSGIIILNQAKYSISCNPIKKYLYHQYQYARSYYPIDTPFNIEDKSILNTVIHIRRGDEFRHARLIDESIFASVAFIFLEEFHRMKDALKTQGVVDMRFHVYSEGEETDFPLFVKDSLLKGYTTLHLNGDPFQAFHSMTKADVLVSLSRSAFANTAALLRDKGLTIGIARSCFAKQHILLDVSKNKTRKYINSTISIPLRAFFASMQK
jgi:hypothetical protein